MNSTPEISRHDGDRMSATEFEHRSGQPAGPSGAAARITVGRNVHFYDATPLAEGERSTPDAPAPLGPRIALTTGVYADDDNRMVADLSVFRPGIDGAQALRAVPFSDEPRAGHWTWQPVQRNQRPDVGTPR